MNIGEIWISIIMPLIAVPTSLYLKMLYDNYFRVKNEYRLKVFNDKLHKMDDKLNNFYWPLYLKLLSIYQLNYNIPIKNKYEYDSSDSSSEDDLEEYVCHRKKCCQRYLKDDIMIKCKSNIPNNSNSLICKKCRWRKSNNNFENVTTNIDGESKSSSNSSQNSDVEITIPIDIDYNKCENNVNCAEIDLISGTGCGVGNVSNLQETNIIIDKNTINTMEETLNKLYLECNDLIDNNICCIGIHEKLNRQVIKFIKYYKIRKIINEGSTNQKYNINYFNVTNNTNKLLSVVEEIVFEKQNEYNKLLIDGPSIFMV